MFTSFQSFEKYYLLAGWNILAQILSVFLGGGGGCGKKVKILCLIQLWEWGAKRNPLD